MTSKVCNKRARAKKIALWSLVAIVAGSLLLPLGGYLAVVIDPAIAQGAEQSNPRANYWSAVRDGVSGYSAVSGQEANVLIQNGGQNWRQWRNGPVASIGPWLLIGVIVALFLYHIIHGKVPVEKPLSGKRVLRWTTFERNLHWITAVMFIMLAITGLSLLFGRAVLIPIFGPAGFATWADVSITVHNTLGPVFIVTIALEIILWIRHNLPSGDDVDWFKQGGGLLGKSKHPHAGRMNAGEKVWFWIIATVGVGVCITGIILDFPNFEQSRGTMQLANLIHGILAIIWIAVALGHIYIGTGGTEGSLEGMTTGYVSAEWAEQHHDRWYEEVKDSPKHQEPDELKAARSPGGAPTS